MCSLWHYAEKEETFDLIYGSRLRRVLSERFRIC